MGWGKDWSQMDQASKLLIQDNNLVFICDNCHLVFDPGISGFQELIDAARQARWKITFHVGKDGYAMACPSCKT